ncbi:DUF2922 domain-containing protein [Clostridium formicaceticum]|uniref:DUF2922 domain-containing protein n=1 Tax=Clostridium formicaceticum TaxID=1497 RepID=A0AAC9WHF6_9CLOT|nr:DUF2922 domain-containing protein [Clostridium formicaceticum]AOY74690.1 hypothetical protein BJL90_01200 [Clostridium formicaceticum]ARE89067.1 hypothetical protein CLFO_34730 [Clostridium formicaceticum]
MDKYLRMVFKTDEDKLVSLRVSDPKEDLTDSEVKAAMETVIASGAIISSSGELVAIDSAYLVETSTTELEVNN